MYQRLVTACLLALSLGFGCDSRESSGAETSTMGAAGARASGGSGAPSGAGAGANSGAGTTAGGSAGLVGGAAGEASGGVSGVAPTGFKCPTGPFPTPILTNLIAKRIPGAPPDDDFNKYDFGNVEGPVWIGDSLYFSEMMNGDIPLARILKLGPGNQVSVAITDSGSNGLAVDDKGDLLAAVHKDGSISQFALPSAVVTVLVASYQSKRFTSPNDLAIRSDGTIYFSDPSYQNSANPQGAERLYWVTPASERKVTAIADAPSTPNGVTLSPDEKTLYVAGSGLKKFQVNADGSLTGATDFVVGGSGDGMVVDCSGNLYVAGNGKVQVYAPNDGTLLGTIAIDSNEAQPTNVAFGGVDHKTLYVTAQGTAGVRGVFSVTLDLPGLPY